MRPGLLIVTPALTLALFAGAAAVGLKWNNTPSMPRGIWIERTLSENAELHRGDIVVACVEWNRKEVEPYVDAGVCQDTDLEPVLKPIAAIPGDTVAVTEAGVVVNGTLLPHGARLSKDGEGAILPFPLPGFCQSVTVLRGDVWLVAPMDKSLDSRYLGPFKAGSIIAVARPLFVE